MSSLYVQCGFYAICIYIYIYELCIYDMACCTVVSHEIGACTTKNLLDLRHVQYGWGFSGVYYGDGVNM